MVSYTIKDKLLSHRLRGYSTLENSLPALQAACASDISYLEIDTRVDRNGEIYVYHNPFIGGKAEKKIAFNSSPTEFIKNTKYKNGEPILTFKKTLDVFQKRKNQKQKLCIDIKDYGVESRHLDLVNKYDLEDDVYWISWIPQSIIDLHKLGAKSPLVFSHINLYAYGIFGKAISRLLKNKIYSFLYFVVMGETTYKAALNHLGHGHLHGYVCRELPSEIKNVLVESGGGICVHYLMLGKRLIEYCKKERLKIWLMFVNNKKIFYKYANNEIIDVLFSDKAPTLFNEISR